jgi:predicted lipoprotein with Yx(FWY)xxD motif
MRLRVSTLSGIFCTLLILSAAPLSGQSPDSYRITPNMVTMRVGDQRNFRMVDQNGRVQQNVTWTLSDAGAFESTQGGELNLLAKQAGHFRPTAQTDFAVAEGEVNVVEESTLAHGTVQWASRAIPGCTNVKIISAAHVAGGPDFFQQTRCADGEYVAAYRSDGVQLWRRKISNNGLDLLSNPGGSSYAMVGNWLNPQSVSICDAVSVGGAGKGSRTAG